MTDLSYTKPAAHEANQVFGGRGGSLWSASVLAEDLRSALADPNLLNALARDIKAGDRLALASYRTTQDFSDEVRDMTATLLITSVVKPDKAEPKTKPGKVSYRVLDLFLLGEKAAKLVEDRGEIETVAKQRRKA